ncbi:MAG: hypothetical protein LBT39_06015, partial [Treponema sp.]|nr:hypothetical protein [Treponema sp.]
ERLITAGDLGLWFDTGHSRWGAFINAKLGAKDFTLLEKLMRDIVAEGPVTWTWKSLLLIGRKK